MSLREEKEEVFHTLCTCGADASRAACGYLIGVKQKILLCGVYKRRIERIQLRSLRIDRSRWSIPCVPLDAYTNEIPVSFSSWGEFVQSSCPKVSAVAI